MTSFSDGGDEMHEQPDEHPLVADFLHELRSWGAGPAPAPSAALATLLEADPVPSPHLPRRKKKMLTQLAGLGILAKAALGFGAAAAAVTTAGATGVLPPPAQHVVATVLEAISPLDLPDPTVDVDVDVDASTPDVSIPAVDDPVDGDDPDDGIDDATNGGGQPDNHGACVSAVAQDKSTTGRDHGQAVSAAARSDCGKEGTTSSTSTSSSTSTTSTSIAGTATVDAGNRGSNSGPGTGHGNGNGNQGNGSGNSGSGNGGSGNSGRSGRS